jgi:hypothetical protein
MKKTFCITSFLMILFTGAINLHSVIAQNTWLGLKGGLSIPSLQGGNTEQSKGYKSRFGPDFGIFGYKDLSDNWALQIELSYVSQGGIKKGIQALDPSMLSGLPVPEGTPLYANFKTEAIMNYIELPILAKYTIPLKKTYKFYIDGGPNFGYLVSAKTHTSGTSQIFLDPSGTQPLEIEGQPLPAQNFKAETDIKNDLKKMNVGITGGVGISRTLGPGDLVLDVRGSYGFINVQKDPVNGQNNTGCLVISLGYAIKI